MYIYISSLELISNNCISWIKVMQILKFDSIG